VGVNLGGGDIGVAEEALDAADVGAVHEQVGGETVAQGVRGDVFGDAGGFGVALYEALDAADGEAGVHAVFHVVFGAGVVDEERFEVVVA